MALTVPFNFIVVGRSTVNPLSYFCWLAIRVDSVNRFLPGETGAAALNPIDKINLFVGIRILIRLYVIHLYSVSMLTEFVFDNRVFSIVINVRIFDHDVSTLAAAAR